MKSVSEMKKFLKKADPIFATDEELDSISYKELVEWYKDCAEAYCVKDDWCARRLWVMTNNM